MQVSIKKRECVDLLKTFNIQWVKKLEKFNVINKNHLIIDLKNHISSIFCQTKEQINAAINEFWSDLTPGDCSNYINTHRNTVK